MNTVSQVKFEIGDRVIVINKGYNTRFRRGIVSMVYSNSNRGQIYVKVKLDGKHGITTLYEEDLDIVKYK